MSVQLLRPRTVTFLLRGSEVLLGWKKQRFGRDYLLGIGGKVENGESIEEAAKREVAEEIAVLLPDLQKVGVFNFIFPHDDSSVEPSGDDVIGLFLGTGIAFSFREKMETIYACSILCSPLSEVSALHKTRHGAGDKLCYCMGFWRGK